jgi:hypothetical protein
MSFHFLLYLACSLIKERTVPTTVFTRAYGKLALAHVMKNVFELPDNHPLNTALLQAGIVKFDNILSMPYNDILDLTYHDGQGNEHLAAKGDKYRLKIFKYYQHYQITVSDSIEDWLMCTWEQCHKYHASKDCDYTLKD